uniref:Uncharacterized protein n=1 Tax=Salix viminalis TaxID=40686 RepID=A0A6N2M4X2_SALVM
MVRNNKKLINDDGSSRKQSIDYVNFNTSYLVLILDDAGIIIEDSLIVNDTSNSQEIATTADAAAMDEKTELRCNIMGRSEFCEMKGDIRIDGNSSTAFIVSSETDILTAENTSWSIRPYARKEALGEKDFARKWSVKPVTSRLDIARCTRNHSVPAILFSAGGYSGNFFHAFTDIIIPLYSTARTFNREVQFLMTDRKPWWIAKHDVHCFHSLTIGLKGETTRNSVSILHLSILYEGFQEVFKKLVFLKKITHHNQDAIREASLLIIPRKGQDLHKVGEIAQLAESLSYQNLGRRVRIAKIINSCDYCGSSWCGLTNIVFLPENAILIQVVPFGMLEWLKSFLRRSCEGMNKVEESTLIQQYPPTMKFEGSLQLGNRVGWHFVHILDKQN